MSLFQASVQTVLMAFLLALPTVANAQKELLKFEHPLIDAGTMTEDDAPRTFTFVGKNVSKKILHLTQVRTTCGCTSSYVKGDVMKPGDTCQVQITFTPNRYPGTINTGAFLYLKEVEGQPVVKLALTGRVLPGADMWARYPHKMGTTAAEAGEGKYHGGEARHTAIGSHPLRQQWREGASHIQFASSSIRPANYRAGGARAG